MLICEAECHYNTFGAPMPGRSFSSDGYRYGFNGKERDLETIGTGGNTYDYGFRIYNPNLGKFLSVDPLTNSYPYYTPFQFAGNSPIEFIDLDGLERAHYSLTYSDNKPVLKYIGMETKFKSFSQQCKEIFTLDYYKTPWQENDGDPMTIWAGYTVHAANGQSYSFQTFDDLLGWSVKGGPNNKDGSLNMSNEQIEQMWQILSFEAYEKGNKMEGDWEKVFIPLASSNITELSEARGLLNKALARQKLDKAPNSFKEKWSENGFEYEVRIHGPQTNAPAGSNSAEKTIFRVGRRKQGTDSNGQGSGWEYADDSGNWYKESELKAGKNEKAADNTHIIVK